MWKAIQYSRQGKGHVANNVPCQDKTYIHQKGDVSAIVLADGAGSAKMSHFGAEAVTKIVAETLCSNFDDFYSQENPIIAQEKLFETLDNTLKSLANELNCEKKDLASTLLAVASTKEKFLIFHLGDGVIGYLADDQIKVASFPNNGEFCNTTVFTTSANAQTQIKLFKGMLSNKITGFIVFSDGVESCMFNHQTKSINQGIVKLFDDLKHLSSSQVKDLLEELFDEMYTYTMDDCSLAAMTWVDNPIAETAAETVPTTMKTRDHDIIKWQQIIIILLLIILALIIAILLIDKK